MKLTNLTPHPALAYEGVDQLGQAFHVVVMRQTYSWNEQGLLVLADEQDPLRFTDQLLDSQDIMSGVIEESDLAHYKPKCDVIIKGYAYTPINRKHNTDFTANITLQTPPIKRITEKNVSNKYQFSQKEGKEALNQNKQDDINSRVLINKTLTILSPRYLTNDNFTGSNHYRLKVDPLPQKISLAPRNSFGGHCIIEADHPVVRKIDNSELIPQQQRERIKLNPNHGLIAYMQQDDHNPYGAGYISQTYLKHIKPKRINLSQIHYPDLLISESLVHQASKSNLDFNLHNKLVAGFGVRAKSHPERTDLIGTVDDEFIKSGAVVPKDFDFAMWNSAYPDQQTDFLQGNEWITLTNLCSPNTQAATITDNGDIRLRLYLPETLAYLQIDSKDKQLMNTELPMRLDTVIVSPDEQKVNLVWRAMIIADYQPKSAILNVLDRQDQESLIEKHYSTKAEVVRPYEV